MHGGTEKVDSKRYFLCACECVQRRASEQEPRFFLFLFAVSFVCFFARLYGGKIFAFLAVWTRTANIGGGLYRYSGEL